MPDAGRPGDLDQGVFDAYAAYYDLLYRDKNYAGEAAYVAGLIRRHHPNARTVLEFGCGTGAHARQLAALGLVVTGIDRSVGMIARAQAAGPVVPGEGDPNFRVGDLRDFRAGRTFDAVIALFHVMSYQTTNEDLAAAMASAAAHLSPGGLFVFDCWYGPGVLTDAPMTRVRRLSGDACAVTRIAEPVHFPNRNRVDVHYEVQVSRGDELVRIREVHAMRYLFAPEVELLLNLAGLRCVALHAWMGAEEPGLGDWTACFIATK